MFRLFGSGGNEVRCMVFRSDGVYCFQSSAWRIKPSSVEFLVGGSWVYIGIAAAQLQNSVVSISALQGALVVIRQQPLDHAVMLTSVHFRLLLHLTVMV